MPGEQLLINGVKARRDGSGDAWANAHREGLGTLFYMQDIDVQFGVMVFGQNSAERMFLEYVPDDYQNKDKIIRQFGYVALFDRKRTKEAAFCKSNIVQTANYLCQCRKLSVGQPETAPCRFFFVFGGNTPPWHHYEINIFTGKPTGREGTIDRLDPDNWWHVWDTLGLHWTRRQIRDWLAKT